MDHGQILHRHVDPISDKFMQWSVQETRDFLMIRAGLDQTFMETKRNKVLWEVTATKMMDMGYSRSAEQCKAKWKNLVTRFKGCETVENDIMRQQFPFYNDLQAIFEARIQRMLWSNEVEAKRRITQLCSDDEDYNDPESDPEKTTTGKPKKKIKTTSTGNTPTASASVSSSHTMKEILDEFMKQQRQIEAEWMKTFEAKEEERRLKEMEWQQKMESLENERRMLDQRWREREEQRMIREEARAKKRDALINALFNKLA